MASTGNVFPTAGVNVDRAANTAWTSPGNVVSDNATDATVVVPSDYLVTSSYGFSIPAGATILGVTVRVEASETGTAQSDYTVQLHSDTTPTLIGTAKGPVSVSGTTKVISTNGSASDLWGATLTPAIVNDAGFGVSIWSTDTVNTLAIDFVTIAVEYRPPVLDENEYEPAGGVIATATRAMASALLAAQFTASLAAGFQFNDDIVPQPAMVEDEYWTNPTQIKQPWLSQQYFHSSAGSIVFAVEDDDGWWGGVLLCNANVGKSAASAAAATALISGRIFDTDEIVSQAAPSPVFEDDTPLRTILTSPWNAPIWIQSQGSSPFLTTPVEDERQPDSYKPWTTPIVLIYDDGNDLPVTTAAFVDDDAGSLPSVSPVAPWTQPVLWNADDAVTTIVDTDFYLPPVQPWGWPAQTVIDSGMDIGNLHANPAVDEAYSPISGYTGWLYQPVPIVDGDFSPPSFLTMEEDEYSYPLTTWPLQWLAPVVTDDGNNLGNLHTNPAVDEDFGPISKYTGWDYKPIPIVDPDAVFSSIAEEEYRYPLMAWPLQWSAPVVIDDGSSLGNLHTNPVVDEDFGWISKYVGWEYKSSPITDPDFAQPVVTAIAEEDYVVILPRPVLWWQNIGVQWDNKDERVTPLTSVDEYTLVLPEPRLWWTNPLRLFDDNEIIPPSSDPAILDGVNVEILTQGAAAGEAVTNAVVEETMYELPPQPVRMTSYYVNFLGFVGEGKARYTWKQITFAGRNLIGGARYTWLHIDALIKRVPIEECPTTPYECVEAEIPPYECVQIPPFACVGIQPEVRIVTVESCPPIEGIPLPPSETPPEEEPPAVESVTIVSPMPPIMYVGQTYMLTVQVLSVPTPGDASQPLSGRTAEFVSSDVTVATVISFAITDKNGMATIPVYAAGLGTFTIMFSCEGVFGVPLSGTVAEPPPDVINGFGSVAIGVVTAGVGSFTALQPGQAASSIGVTSTGVGVATDPPAFGQSSIGVVTVGSGIFIEPSPPPPEITGTASVTVGVVTAGVGDFTPLQPGNASSAIGVIAAGVGNAVDPAGFAASLIGVASLGAGTFTPPPPPPIVVTSVIVTPCPSSGVVGGSIQLSADPRDASNNHVVGAGIIWGTSNPAVAQVGTDDGSESHRAIVTFVGVGSAIISAASIGP